MARVLDTAAVRVQAETRGGERDAARAGRRFGREFTKAADREVGRSDLADKLADQVDSASRRVVKARSKEANAAGQLRVAELRLQQVRDSGKAKTAQLAAAEERVGVARRALVQAQRDADSAAGKLAVSERRLADAHTLAAGEADKQRRAVDALSDSADRAGKDRTGKVKLEPLDEAFARDVRALVARISRQVNAQIPMTARGERFRREIATRIREVESTLRARIEADPDLSPGFRRELKAKVDAITRSVRGRVDVDVDVDRHGGGRRGLGGLIGLGAQLGSTLAGPLTAALKTSAGWMGSLLSSAAGAGLQFFLMASKAALLTPVLAAVAGAATAAFGAITAGAFGLPVLLSTLIGPIAAIALGIDGITNAAKTLSPEFDHLRVAVSDVFQDVLTPAFESLRPIFPVLEHGLKVTAFSLGAFADELAKVFSSASGLEIIESIFTGINTAISAAVPGLVGFITTLFAVAGQVDLYRILGETIGGVADRFADMLAKATGTGVLAGALVQLKDILFEVTDLLGVLAQGALEFLVGAGPGITGFFHEIGEALKAVDFKALGETFGGLLERLGKAINDIPTSTWENLGSAIAGMAEEIVHLIESGALQLLIEDFTRLIENTTPFIPVLFGIIDALIWLSVKMGDFLGDFGGFADGIKDIIGDLFDWLGIGSPAQKFVDMGLAIIEGLLLGLSGGPQQVWDKVKEMAQKALDALADAPTLLTEKGRQWVESAKRGIGDKLGDLRAKAAEIKDQVKGALSDAGQWLYSVGQDVAGGLARGISAGASRVVAEARSVAQRAYQAAKSALGISSPSRLFAGIGRDAIAGFLVGLQQQIAPMLGTIRELFARAATETRAAFPGRVDAAFAALGSAGRDVTARAVGSGVPPGVDLPTLMEGLARVLNAAELRADRDGITLMVRDGDRMLARR